MNNPHKTRAIYFSASIVILVFSQLLNTIYLSREFGISDFDLLKMTSFFFLVGFAVLVIGVVMLNTFGNYFVSEELYDERILISLVISPFLSKVH